MSLQAKQTYVVPEATAQVARSIFPEGSPVMRMLDELHMIIEDRDFADPFSVRGQPAEAPGARAEEELAREQRVAAQQRHDVSFPHDA